MPAGRLVFIAPQADLSSYWSLFREALGLPDDIWSIMHARSERWLKTRYDDLQPGLQAPHMRTPLLILHGINDRVTPFAEGKKLASLWPGAELKPLDSGHLSILRDWRALLASLDFIKR
jgi:pimeloyl-ACP methyl ester carboxylesterase